MSEPTLIRFQGLYLPSPSPFHPVSTHSRALLRPSVTGRKSTPEGQNYPMRRSIRKTAFSKVPHLSGSLNRQGSMPNVRDTRLFPLPSRRTLPAEVRLQPVPKQENSLEDRTEPDTEEDSSSEDYSFIKAAKVRAVEDSYSHSSEELDLQPASAQTRRVIFTAQRSHIGRTVRKEQNSTVKVGRGCLWVGVMLEKLGLKGTKGRKYAVGVTAEVRNRWVGRGLYNHIPGLLGLYKAADLSEMIKTSLWPNLSPLSFNSNTEAYSFARYRSQHPKSLWFRRALLPPFKVKTVSAHSAIKG